MRRDSLAAGRTAFRVSLVVGWLALAPAAASADPAPESVSGAGTVASTRFQVSINAGPFGQNPSGYLHVQGFFEFDATPTCLNEAAGAGVSGYRIDTGPLAGEGFLSSSGLGAPLVAGSQPIATPAQADATIVYSGILAKPPLACPPPGSAPPPFLESGGGGTVTGTLGHTGGPTNPVPLQQLQFTTPGAAPAVIAQAIDGTLWFTESTANRIASIPNDGSGRITEYPIPTASAGLGAIAPDLAESCTGTTCGSPGMWFTESAANKVGHITPAGEVQEYALPSAGAAPSSIAPDAVDGGAWFTEPGVNQIGHVTANGGVTEYPVPSVGAEPQSITADLGDTGPTGDGAWFVEAKANKIGYIDARGTITEFAIPTAASGPSAIADDAGAGAWFIESAANKIGHVTSSGKITENTVPTAGAGLQALAIGPGPDGSAEGVWFSESAAGQLGFDSASGQISEFSLPGVRPGGIALAEPLGMPPLSGYLSSEAVWWTDSDQSAVGLARFPLGSSSVPSVSSGPVPIPGGHFHGSPMTFSIPRRLIVRGSAIRVRISCPGSATCRGTVLVESAHTHATKASRTLAAAAFSVRPRHRTLVRVRLNRFGRRALRGHPHGLPVTVAVRSSTGAVPEARLLTLALARTSR